MVFGSWYLAIRIWAKHQVPNTKYEVPGRNAPATYTNATASKLWGSELQVMPFQPFPGKSAYRSQEMPGGAIRSSDQGYLIAYIDGGARGNPGPAGYGVVFEDEVERPVAELSEFLGRQTNNYAEYSA